VHPKGRYGHTLTWLGTNIYIFGGQDGPEFMNGLVAFDLDKLQKGSYRWEILIKDGDNGQPPARTNHSMINFRNELYL